MRQELVKDRSVAAIAGRQYGLITAEQLAGAGISPSAIKWRVRAGRLHRLHRGVYAVGHLDLSARSHWLAAVLACGEGAVLSHESAGILWAILPSSTSPPFVHVTVPTRGGRSQRAGIKVHRSRTLAPEEVTRRHNIPVTTYARTLRDLGLGAEPTRSELERIFIRLCRRHRLPKPEVNVRIGRHRVDFLWRKERLVVETDGYRHHSSRASFEADRSRDIDLKLQGFAVIRLTHRQVTRQPQTVVTALRALLHGSPSDDPQPRQAR